MNSLSIRTKFIIAFMSVGLLAIALVGVFTSVVSNQEFQDLVLDRFKSDFSAVVIEYYEANGTLLGIERVFRTSPPGDLTNFEKTNQTGFILALPNGGILLGEPAHPAGTFLSEYEIKKATAIIYDSKTIAYLITFNPTFQPNPQEQRYIETTNKAMLYASLFAISLAVILGLIFTRTLLKPLSDLSTALSKMEQGKLSQTVEKSSDDELGEVIEGFNQMSVALTSSNARRDQMTADIAHELRSPLTVINGYLEGMQDGSLEISKERLSFIQDEVNQLNRLVNDLRTLALADMGQLNISKDLITINTLFTHLKNAYAIPSEAKDISLTFENFGESTLFADEGRLIQVISNLLNNAIRHTDPGGSISVQSYNPTDGSTIIEVEDTGEGIPKEDLPNIFNRFYRGDPSRQGYESESGLGLSIVKALIEAHGGSVRVESTLGEGTIFYITLPAAD
jgi:signal transduction histidine kinase